LVVIVVEACVFKFLFFYLRKTTFGLLDHQFFVPYFDDFFVIFAFVSIWSWIYLLLIVYDGVFYLYSLSK